MKTQAALDRITVHSYSDYRNTVVVPNATAQDAALSWAARGLLTYMLSMPPEWQFCEADLVGRSPMGRDHLRSLVRELESHHYLRRTPLYDARHRKVGSLWEVWPRPFLGPEDAQPGEAEQPLDGPLTENPSMDAVSPWTENPSVDRTQSQPAISLPTENPSMEDQAATPPTGFPPTENPSVYKKHIEQKPHKPPSSSLRSEEPPRRGERTRKPVRSKNANDDTSQQPAAASAAARSASKAVQAAPATTDSQKPKQAASRGRNAARALPAFAEPVRGLLEDWWRLRKQRHRASAGDALTPRSISALEFAHSLGVLQAFAELAAESGWLSLGFNGHRDFIRKLADDQNLNNKPGRSGFRTLGSTHGATTRQSAAADRVIAMFSAQPETLSHTSQDDSCFTTNSSSISSQDSSSPYPSRRLSPSEVWPSPGLPSPMSPSGI